MNKKKRQAISLVGVLTVMIAFFITPIMALAASVNYEKIGDYVSTWHVASLGGLHWTDNGVHMIKADNQLSRPAINISKITPISENSCTSSFE